MSYDAILAELESVQNALGTDDPEQIDGALDRLSDEYDSVRPRERSRVARLQVAIEDGLTSDQREVASTYKRWNVATYLARAGILTAGDLYLLDPDGTDASEIQTKVGELAKRERSLAEATGSADELLGDVELPAPSRRA